ncbi:cytochrome P450, family 81, subfamily D, polypeptide 2 [Hibiscus trionum]|uniref:Cytochrome P450, family 81, subfamily D, polypeptide 2 n=1 Tax=Hibiscus trionum TaxID=183268 RepID=A0A9W7HNT8_HIBTR|nr:cytochrome P450, family 81, subfamily D, polypeptide 2 [Hibiscus trionum]
MDYLLLFAFLFLLLLVIKLFQQTNNTNPPPSPPSLPILGHIYLLREPLHRCFFDLTRKYGPIFSLRLGSRLAIVVSSPSYVVEAFNKNDVVFANRLHFWAGKYIGYNYTSLGLSPYGDHWRNLRRISKHELLSPNQLKLTSGIRTHETRSFIKTLYDASGNATFVKVELKPMFTNLAFNMILRMITGKLQVNGDNMRRSKAEEARFQKFIEELFEIGPSGYIGDFLPLFQWIDFRGYKKNVVRLTTEIDAFLQGFIEDHRRRKGADDFENENSMIHSLLSYQEQQPEYYTDEVIKGLLQDILSGGTDTSAVTMEWAMTNLLNNEAALNKVRSELDLHFGEDKLLDEADLPKLHYLQNVVVETLRLHPAVPLLVPHMNSENCTIGNHHIPKGTMLFVNACAIQRDPNIWDQPMSFSPERFEQDGENDQRHPKMMPFGIGRRSCPGMELGQRVVGLVLGLLIQLFEWKRIDEKMIDMGEGKGLTMPKVEPLEAMFKPRNIAHKLLS